MTSRRAGATKSPKYSRSAPLPPTAAAAAAAAAKEAQTPEGQQALQEAQQGLQSVAQTAGQQLQGVWNAITPTQPVYPGTVIPRSFQLVTSNGSVWVHGNATKHLAEYVTSMLGRGVNPELVKVATQTQLQSLQAAVQGAIAQGVPYGQLINVGGWELKFGAPAAAGQLPALIHALPNP